MISTEDMITIHNYLKDFFVPIGECNDRHEKEGKEMTELKLQVAKIATQTSALLKVCSFIAGGMGTLILGAIGALIFKG